MEILKSIREPKNKIKESKKTTEESDPKKIMVHDYWQTSKIVQDIQLKDLPHRYQHITTHNQMVFINDSKATNLTALKFALNKMSNPYVLILCGDPDKEQYESYEIIGPTKVYIFGNHAEEISSKIFHPEKIVFNNKGLSLVMRSIFKRKI